jgi:hypothetical protein
MLRFEKEKKKNGKNEPIHAKTRRAAVDAREILIFNMSPNHQVILLVR